MSVHHIERRSGPRVSLLLRTAKLKIDGRELLCIMRDVSDNGIRIRLFNPLPEHKKLELEVGTGATYPVQVVWQTEDQAGLCFVGEVDLGELIDDSKGAFPKRQVRVSVDMTGIIHARGATCLATFRNISQQGASIECSQWLAIDELVRIEIPNIAPIYAKVRWRRPPRYGLVFEQTFSMDGLARFCSAGQLQGKLAVNSHR